jgi:predicted Zn-dependent protease
LSIPSPLGVALCAALLCACQTAEAVSTEAELPPPAAPERRSAVAEEAIQKIEGGQLEHARDLLDELVLAEHVGEAQRRLATGAPEDALVSIDRALELAPDDPGLRLLKADASLRLAEAKLANGGGNAGLIEGALTDALDSYGQARSCAHASFGASRAAWRLGRTQEALDRARAGIVQLASEDPRAAELAASELGFQPHRLYAEQAVAAYFAARTEGLADTRALRLEAEDALTRLIGRSLDDPWAWSTLSDLYEGDGDSVRAKGMVERGLRFAPRDEGLLERLARTTSATDGPVAAVKALEACVAREPAVGAARWHLFVARFQAALSGLKQEPPVLDPLPFQELEREFSAFGTAEPRFADGARGYQIVCRLARGWCAFHAGDLARARAEFSSMGELVERGAEWSLPGELESGIMGLFQVADAYNTREDKLAAGEVFEQLHALQPDLYLWANNAGVSLRDAARDLEEEGRKLCRAARGSLTKEEALAELRPRLGEGAPPPGSSAERAAFGQAANEDFARAREWMERSWTAYRAAAELAPEDVRVVNDAALILVYYLHRDLEWAEAALLRCVELGGRELEAKRAALATEEAPERAATLDAELAQLTEAFGDAHENLGVLLWIYRRDAAGAQDWLEKAIEIWPTTRQPVTNSLLPQIRGELQPEEDDRWDLLNWAQPCPIR